MLHGVRLSFHVVQYSFHDVRQSFHADVQSFLLRRSTPSSCEPRLIHLRAETYPPRRFYRKVYILSPQGLGLIDVRPKSYIKSTMVFLPWLIQASVQGGTIIEVNYDLHKLLAEVKE